MKKTQGRKAKKAVKKVAKKASTSVKKKTAIAKGKTQDLLRQAQKQLKTLKKKSSVTLHKIYATEEDIKDYVKENPVKSISAIALTGLIAGFLSRFRK